MARRLTMDQVQANTQSKVVTVQKRMAGGCAGCSGGGCSSCGQGAHSPQMRELNWGRLANLTEERMGEGPGAEAAESEDARKRRAQMVRQYLIQYVQQLRGEQEQVKSASSAKTRQGRPATVAGAPVLMPPCVRTVGSQVLTPMPKGGQPVLSKPAMGGRRMEIRYQPQDGVPAQSKPQGPSPVMAARQPVQAPAKPMKAPAFEAPALAMPPVFAVSSRTQAPTTQQASGPAVEHPDVQALRALFNVSPAPKPVAREKSLMAKMKIQTSEKRRTTPAPLELERKRVKPSRLHLGERKAAQPAIAAPMRMPKPKPAQDFQAKHLPQAERKKSNQINVAKTKPPAARQMPKPQPTPLAAEAKKPKAREPKHLGAGEMAEAKAKKKSKSFSKPEWNWAPIQSKKRPRQMSR